MMNIVKTIFFAFICIASGLAWKIYTNKSTTTQENQLIMGIAAGYAPWISMNEQGAYEGFDIDVAQALAVKLNKQLVLKDCGSMTPLLLSLEQNSVDALIWGLEITKERREKFCMINYQGEKTTSYPLIFWQTIPANVQTLADMQNKIICVEPSSSQSVLLRPYKDIIIRPTERVDDALLALQYQKADAAFVEPAIAKKFKNKFPEIQILDIHLDVSEEIDGCGIAVKKENITISEAIKQAIETLKQDGTIARLEKKWGLV